MATEICETCGNDIDVWGCGLECSAPETVQSRYIDWGDAWTLADDRNPAAIRDAGYEGNEELALFRDGKLVINHDLTIDEVARYMKAHANREASARNKETWLVAKRA